MKKIKLTSKIIFNKKIAMRFSKPQYYRVYGDEIRNLPKRANEKSKYSTIKQIKVSRLFEQYRKLLKEKSNGIFHVIKGIYNKNKQALYQRTKLPVHTNIMSLVASVPILIVSYNRIRGNKGSTTLGAMLSFHRARKLNPTQRQFLSRSWRLPDGINYDTFITASNFLKEGKYPWGSSRRIYIDKPGQPEKKRPITIPPFMDRVIQTAILFVLEAIYEPSFEITNRSFGFRSRRGVHDAIYALTRRENKGFTTAIEGDIKGAYDNVNRKILINILSKRINDRKFLQLMEDRLDYQVYDEEKRTFIEEGKVLPQGGIDSPYLWNIYMHEFDLFVNEYMTNLLDRINKKIRPNLKPSSKTITKEMASTIHKRRSLLKTLNLAQKHNTEEKFLSKVKSNQSIRANLSSFYKNPNNLVQTQSGKELSKSVRYNLIKEIKQVRHKSLNLPATNPNKRFLRFEYVRYADDWIILGNFNKILANTIKNDISQWLKHHLDAQLAEEKTLITDITNPLTPARFLGFEISSKRTRKLAYKLGGNQTKPSLTRVNGSEIQASPDRQRLISRLHMKGFCTKNGLPRPQSWMSTLETFALISRFNSVLLGLGNFYYGFVNKSSLNRWIHIIRTSLLKTLAQKYDTNIKGIFTRFGIRSEKGNTIEYYVINTFNERNTKKRMKKTWTLITERELQERCLKNDRYNEIKSLFNTLEYDKIIPDFSPDSSRKSNNSIKDDDWINNLMWVNLRTQASLDAPCCRKARPNAKTTMIQTYNHVNGEMANLKTKIQNLKTETQNLKTKINEKKSL